MSAHRQYLVVPLNPMTASYVTNNADVAHKRVTKGDFVAEIDRREDGTSPTLHRIVTSTPPTQEDEDEL